MKILHTTEWSAPQGHAVVEVHEDNDLGSSTKYRTVVVRVDGHLEPDETRRLITDLQHAVALAEEVSS